MNAQQKHTPGPWFYTQEGVAAYGIVGQDGHSVVHLSALLNSVGHRDIEANARLIAAAPDLLASLTECLREIDAEIEQRQHSGNDEDWQELQRISNAGHAAMAKAGAA